MLKFQLVTPLNSRLPLQSLSSIEIAIHPSLLKSARCLLVVDTVSWPHSDYVSNVREKRRRGWTSCFCSCNVPHVWLLRATLKKCLVTIRFGTRRWQKPRSNGRTRLGIPLQDAVSSPRDAPTAMQCRWPNVLKLWGCKSTRV